MDRPQTHADSGLGQVEFHTGVADPAVYACRLLRKASRRGSRVLLTAPAALLAEIDEALWQVDEHEFLPHIRWPLAAQRSGGEGAAPATLMQRTPLWLCTSLAAARSGGALATPDILVNVDAEAPPDTTGLRRLIEILGVDPDAVQRGRVRWQAYKAAGLEVVHHRAG